MYINKCIYIYIYIYIYSQNLYGANTSVDPETPTYVSDTISRPKQKCFSPDLNLFVDVLSLILSGSEFQMVGASWLNARNAIFVRPAGTESDSCRSEAGRRAERVCRTGTCRCNKSDRYYGCPVVRAMWVNVANLYLIRWATGDQWNSTQQWFSRR